MNSISHRLCAGLVLLGLAGAASAQTVAPPNIHILVDTTGSMRDLPQVVNSNHDEFFTSTTGGCFNPRLDALQGSGGWHADTVYPVPDMGTQLGSDTGFPNLFLDGKLYAYTSWGDSSNPAYTWDTKEQACQTAVTNWSTTNAAEYSRCLSCVSLKGYFKASDARYDPGRPVNMKFIFSGRFLNFNPPKYVSMRVAIKQAFKELQRARVGFSYYSASSPYTSMARAQNPSCSQILADPSSFDASRASYIASVNGLRFSAGTTVGRSLLNIGYHFTSGIDIYRDWLGFGTYYGYPAEFANYSLTSQGRSVCWGCQQNAVIIISDSEPSSDSLSAGLVSQLRAVNGGPVYCPATEPCGGGTTATRDMGTDPLNPTDDNPNYYLDDVARMLATQDLQMASPPVVGDFDTTGQQSVTVHAVGYGAHSNLLKNAAAVGGGLYYSTTTAAGLKQALMSIIADAQTRSSSCVLYP